MTAGKASRDVELAPLGHRFAADLSRRAAAAGLPRVYVPVGDALQAAALEWLQQHSAQLDADARALWLRRIEELDHAVAEFVFAPGHHAAQLVLIDSPAETLLRELGDLARIGMARLDAADELADDDQRARVPQPFERGEDQTRTAATLEAAALRGA